MSVFRFASLRGAGVIVLLVTCLTTAPRGAMAQDASEFIANLGTQGMQVLGPSVPAAQRAARFRQLLETEFDLPEIARFVLGPYGRRMSPVAQQEFVPLFREYLVRAYTAKLGPYGGAPFRVVGARPNGGETVVASQVTRNGGNPLQIEWHVSDRGGRPVVTDVAVDGVSMKASQRNEFAAIIQRNGGQPDSLVAALRQQTAEAR